MINKNSIFLIGLLVLCSCKNQANNSNKEKGNEKFNILSSSGLPVTGATKPSSESSKNPATSTGTPVNGATKPSAESSKVAATSNVNLGSNTNSTNSVPVSVSTKLPAISVQNASQKMDTSLIGDSFDMSNPNSLKFKKISELTVDEKSNTVYILNEKNINKLSIVDHKNVLLNKNDPAIGDSNIEYVGIEVDLRNNTVSTIEYRNSGTFYGVKRFYPDGHSDYAFRSNEFESVKKIETASGKNFKSFTTIEFDSYIDNSLALNRLKNGLYLKFKSKDNQYFWIDLSNKKLNTIWDFNCLRTDKCDGSANLLELTMMVQFQPKVPYITDSNGNTYDKNVDCQLTIKSKANGGIVSLGEKCNIK